MNMNIETPPDWQTDTLAQDMSAGHAPPRRGTLRQRSGEFLLSRLLGKIIRTGTLKVRMPSGRIHAFGTGAPLVAVRLTTTATVWRLLRNPELAVGEAYMDGSLQVEQGGIYDLRRT